jgi:4-amino-4-deoxy-L-arabinose transferase-like glycosyltransferase
VSLPANLITQTKRTPEFVWPLVIILTTSLWRFVIAATLPITQDEAYYAAWAHTLAWGYFDHPPAIALFAWGTTLVPGSVFAVRAGSWLATTCMLIIIWRFYQRCEFYELHTTKSSTTNLALLAIATSPVGLAVGIIATPDTPLLFFWTLALHELLAALSGQPRRWLSTGLAVGLGLLSKYTMILIVPVILWALLKSSPHWWRCRWLWFGVATTGIVLLPHLLWNAHHDWLSIRYQFGHGFALETPAFQFATDQLPIAQGLDPVTAPEPWSWQQRFLNGLEFIGGQVLLWGALLFGYGSAILTTLRQVGSVGLYTQFRDRWQRFPTIAHTILLAATLVPLLTFASIAWLSDVEANWSAMYLITAAPLITIGLALSIRWVLASAVINVIILSYLTLHITTNLPTGIDHHRSQWETHGFAALAHAMRQVSSPPTPVFADRYQLAAMINFYEPGFVVGQWPGITRPSEFSRATLAPLPHHITLQEQGFWLLTQKPTPITIAGFHITQHYFWLDCLGSSVVVTDETACRQPLRMWRYYHYQANGSNQTHKDHGSMTSQS